jgi:HK97 family phage prohead protease
VIKGLAAVYNKWSLDLGGFRERNLPGAFDRVLSEDPHVIHTWDHDTARALSSTRSKQYPLELSSVSKPKAGLGFYSRVAPTDDARNLRILMEGGIVEQSSYAFTVRDSEWRYLEEEDMLERDIIEIEGLYDVTTCAMGAFPQTDSEIAVRSLLKGAKRSNGVFFPSSVTATASGANPVTLTTSFGTRSSGAEGNAEPAPDPAPDAPEGTDAADPTPDEGGSPPANEPDPKESAPEDGEAKEREFKLWQKKRAAEHRRTREFAYGVLPQKEEK